MEMKKKEPISLAEMTSDELLYCHEQLLHELASVRQELNEANRRILNLEADYSNTLGERDVAREELARVRRQIEDGAAFQNRQFHALLGEALLARGESAEIDARRLKEALERIANYGGLISPYPLRIAREALTPPEAGKD